MKKRTFTRVAVFGSVAALGLAGCGGQAATTTPAADPGARRHGPGEDPRRIGDVNAVGPGVIETPLTAPIKQNEEWYNAYAMKNPMNRWAQASEMAGPTSLSCCRTPPAM